MGEKRRGIKKAKESGVIDPPFCREGRYLSNRTGDNEIGDIIWILALIILYFGVH